MIYVIAAPKNQLDVKDRASGWRNVPLNKKAKKEWLDVLTQVKDKGVQHVFASDLDGEAGHAAANELRVPVRLDFGYRRFNAGRQHGGPVSYFDDTLRNLEQRWKVNPEIPIRGGDSLLSYKKRFVKNFNKLLESDADVLFVTDKRTMHAIRGQFDPHSFVPNGNPIPDGKVFKVKKG